MLRTKPMRHSNHTRPRQPIQSIRQSTTSSTTITHNRTTTHNNNIKSTLTNNNNNNNSIFHTQSQSTNSRQSMTPQSQSVSNSSLLSSLNGNLSISNHQQQFTSTSSLHQSQSHNQQQKCSISTLQRPSQSSTRQNKSKLLQSKLQQFVTKLSTLLTNQKRSLYMWNVEEKSQAEIAWHNRETIAPNEGDIIGIKLGPTNLSIAYTADGFTFPVTHRDQATQTPVAVSISADGLVLYGKQAMEMKLINPTTTVYDFLKFMGRDIDDPISLKDQELVPYQLESVNGHIGFKLWDATYSIDKLITFVLGPMRYIINRNVYREVDQCVLTVPTWFVDEQIDILRETFIKNGFKIKDIILEPIAAALAYGSKRKPDSRIAVWDMGATTFTFSLLQALEDGSLQVRSTKGSQYLGGIDFDLIITDYVLNEIQTELGIDLQGDELAMDRIKNLSKTTREKLTTDPIVDIDLPFIYVDQLGPKHYHSKLTREKFHEITMPMLWRTINFMNRAFQESDWNVDQVDEVILAGGVSRWPLIKQLVTEYFRPIDPLDPNAKRIPIKDHLPPDEITAYGAAQHGANLKWRSKHSGKILRNPITIGYAINGGGVYIPVLKANNSLPTIKQVVIETPYWDTKQLSIDIYQGERGLTRFNRYIGSLTSNLKHPDMNAAELKYIAEFEINSHGMLSVSLLDPLTDHSVKDNFGSIHTHGKSEKEIVDERELAYLMKLTDEALVAKMKLFDRVQNLYHQLSTLYNLYLTRMNKSTAENISKHLKILYQMIQNPEGYSAHVMNINFDQAAGVFRDAEGMWHQSRDIYKIRQKKLSLRQDATPADPPPTTDPTWKPNYGWYPTIFGTKSIRDGLTSAQVDFLDELAKEGKYGPDKPEINPYDWRIPNPRNPNVQSILLHNQFKQVEDFHPAFKSRLTARAQPKDHGQFHPDFDGKRPQELEDLLEKREKKWYRSLLRRQIRLQRRRYKLEAGMLPGELSELSEFDGGEHLDPMLQYSLSNDLPIKPSLKTKKKKEKKIQDDEERYDENGMLIETPLTASETDEPDMDLVDLSDPDAKQAEARRRVEEFHDKKRRILEGTYMPETTSSEDYLGSEPEPIPFELRPEYGNERTRLKRKPNAFNFGPKTQYNRRRSPFESKHKNPPKFDQKLFEEIDPDELLKRLDESRRKEGELEQTVRVGAAPNSKNDD